MDDHKEINEQAASTQTKTQASSKSSNKQGLLGLALVGVGLLAVLTNVGDESGFLWTGMISAVMFFAYYRTKAYGLLIPACILAGVTAGIVLELISPDSFEGIFLIGLGAGFVAIDRIEQHKTRWPLYPGIILLAIGTVIIAQTLFNNMLFALMLIIVGAFLLLRNREVLDSMVDIKADVDIRIGEDAPKTDSTKTFASDEQSAEDLSAEDLSSKDNASQNAGSEKKTEVKAVVVDIMPEDADKNDAKDVKVADIDLNAADAETDEVIEIEANVTDENVKDLDDAVSSIKKAVDKIVEDANLPKNDS